MCAPGTPARSNSSSTAPVTIAVSPAIDDVGIDKALRAPDELALGIAGDVGVTVADVAAVRREAQVGVVQLAQRCGVTGDERRGATSRRFEDLVARAQAMLWARRDSPRISARMRSRRGSEEWSTYFIVAATAGWRSAIAVCIACATAR